MRTVANKLYVAIDKSVHLAAFNAMPLPETGSLICIPVCDELSTSTVGVLQNDLWKEVGR